MPVTLRCLRMTIRACEQIDSTLFPSHNKVDNRISLVVYLSSEQKEEIVLQKMPFRKKQKHELLSKPMHTLLPVFGPLS